MKYPAFAFSLIILTSVFFSCHKSSSGSTPGLQIPWQIDSLPDAKNISPAAGSTIDDLPILNVDGFMMVCDISGQLKDTTGAVNSFFRQWAAAHFREGSSYVNVGDITLNWTMVPVRDTTMNHYYQLHDTSLIWNEGSTNHWQINGGGSSVIAADIPGIMPSFTGTMPPIVSLDHDLSLTFNSSNIVNGDLAYIVVFNWQHRYISTPVSTNGGAARISVGDLKNMTNQTMPLLMPLNYPYTPPIYFGGFIGVVVFSHVEQTFGAKKYSFVRERVYLQNVTFEHGI